MDAPLVATQWKTHRFPLELSSHAVGLSLRCGLSCRDVEEFLLERGLIVTEEAIRTWRRANELPAQHFENYGSLARKRMAREGERKIVPLHASRRWFRASASIS